MKKSKDNKAILYFDGGSRPTNPGPSGFAAVLIIGSERHIVSRYIGFKSNNQAEYMGLIVGLKMALDHNIKNIQIYTDSKLVEGHLCKGWKRKDENTKYLSRRAEALLKQFPQWKLNWVKRTENTEADSYCTKAIKYGRNLNPFLSKKYAPNEAYVVDPFSTDAI